MLYDYRKESKSPMLLTLANGKTIEENLLICGLPPKPCPKGKLCIISDIRTMIGVNQPL